MKNINGNFSGKLIKHHPLSLLTKDSHRRIWLCKNKGSLNVFLMGRFLPFANQRQYTQYYFLTLQAEERKLCVVKWCGLLITLMQSNAQMSTRSVFQGSPQGQLIHSHLDIIYIQQQLEPKQTIALISFKVHLVYYAIVMVCR